jgi:P27 family predicted phage terminase small subunit
MGRKIIPTELKILKKTYRKDRDRNAPPPSKDNPVPPTWINQRAKIIFRLMVKRLDALGLASRTFTETIALLASRLEEVERLTRVLEEKGQTYGGINRDGGEYFKCRPEVLLRERAMIHSHKLLVEFGLTPAAIQRVSTKKKEKKVKNPFER